MIGRELTHYRIVERLGSGGMGVLYRADDTKLGRSTALKFLPPEATSDPDAKRRFILEAQAASALDHPNICTIYEIGESADGQLFIAMAYYAGETLKAKIERGPLRLNDALDYTIQTALGLVNAHAAGIVHRDIKPANVLVTKDGLVKILDFGIAKLGGDATMTRTGTTLGTLAYMSPEQLSGRIVDARTDVWSLGVVLYEMIAGRRPFKGEHPQVVANAIAQSTPDPLSGLRPDLPIALDRIVDRALTKDLNERYQTAADLLAELRQIHHDSATRMPALTAGGPAGRPRSGRWLWWTAAASTLAAVATLLLLSRRGAENKLPRLSNPAQVAGSIGEERLPSWSADGRMLAYQSDQAGNNDIWITQIGGTAVNRTADFAGGDEAPRLSPDGRQIAFWSAREGAGIFLMPALGGSPRKIAPGRQDVAAAAAWSPDGTQLAYPIVGPAAEGQPRLEILDLKSGTVRRVALRGSFAASSPERRLRPGGVIDMAWSPNGQFLAALAANSYNNQTSGIWTLRLNDGKWTALTAEDKEIDWSPSWSPDNHVLFFTSNRDGGTMDLWRQRVTDAGEPAGAPDRITTGLDALQATLTADGRRIAYAKGRRVANVWRVPILADRPAAWPDAQQVTIDQRYIEAFDLSPDGRRLVVASDRGGYDDIWILPAGGGDMQRLTDDPTPDFWPTWSPDGREIALYSNRAGNRQLWVLPVAGGSARRLTEKVATFPRWSRDGKSIYFDNNGIWSIPASGGEAKQMVKTGPPQGGLSTMAFTFAPDGQSFVTMSGQRPDERLWQFSVSGGEGRPLTKGQATAPRWSLDGKWIYFTTFREGGDTKYQLERSGLNVWRISPDGKSEQPVTALSGRRGYLGLALAADASWLYFTWREDVADIWMMDVEGLAKH